MPPNNSNEIARLNALHDHYILDTLREDEFDRYTQLIAIICEVPISLISLIDERRQWFKSKIGLDIEQTKRELAFCEYTIRDNKIFTVEDATVDPRFSANELVTGDPNIKFYAGFPLIDANGFALGSLCVIDRVSRKLSASQQKALQLIAEEVTALIVNRKENKAFKNFQKLFNLSDDLLCIAGYDGYFKQINPSFIKLLGYDEQYLLETPSLELLHPDDVEATDNERTALQQGTTSLQFTNRYRTKSGSYKTIQWTTSPDSEQSFLYAIGKDVTTQKMQEKLLQESESKLKSFFENSQGLLYTHAMDGQMLSINKNGAAIVGTNPENIQKISLYDIIPPAYHDDLGQYLANIKHALNSANLMTTVGADGKFRTWAYNNVICADANGNDFVIGNAIDLTDRLRLENELKKIKEILERTNRVAKVGGWEYDVINESIYWSAVTKEIHEVPEDFVPDILTAIEFYKAGDDRALISEVLTNAMLHGKEWDHELKIITAKGKEQWVRAIGKPEMQAGKCVRLFGTFQDIDHQKKEDLKLKKSALLIQKQNDRLLNFAHIVSHNLRSYTGNLKMILQLIKDEQQPEEKIKFMDHLDSISQSLNLTIDNLTEIVKIQTDVLLTRKPVKFEFFFHSSLNVLSMIINNENACVTGDFDEVPEVEHIPAYMDSIMLNFISNAIKYKHPDKSPVIEVKSFMEDDRKCLSFSDNGIGIDLDIYGKDIFGMYKTFHKHPDARGIGLFITKNQIEAVGGSIEVTSQPGIGTTFKITF